MAKFIVKASEFKNICKAVNDRKLAELKKEIIEILKKQDTDDFKKAADYLNSQEEHFTHLEKSLSGKWIEKAGYGIGTVRVWKGKKYKKIAPGKWARVFEKEGRGTNIAIGKLIARVNKIDNVEDLMAFVMANKQRFVDENGIDLPVLDKLRTAVDARNGNVGSKTTSKPAEKKKTFKQEMDELYDAQDKAWEGFESGSEIKSTPENSKKFYERVKKFVDDNNIKLSQKHYDEIEEMNGHSFNEALALAGAYGEEAKKKELARNKEYSQKYKGQILDLSMIDEFKESEAEKKELSMKEKVLIATDEGSKKELGRGKMYKKYITEIQKIANSNINDIPENLKTINDFVKYQDSLSNPDYKQAGKDYARLKNHELAREIWQKVEDGEAEWDDNGYLKLNEHGLLAKPEKKEESETYWIQDNRGNRLTNEDAKKRIKDQLNQINSFNELIAERSKADSVKMEVAKRSLEEDNKYLMERLNSDDKKELVSKIKKSLFDGFLGLELLEKDVEDVEEDKEEESLWNDYSAEEPESFNSVELQVREAMNRRYSNCL